MQLFFAFAVAIGFAIALFKVTPALITSALPIHKTGYFVVVEGLIRVTIFVLYLALISLLPDLRRVFQYHAAEHKAINALEAGDELVPEIVQRHSLIHPRCGTAFLLWVMVIAIFVFAFFGRPAWYWLIATRILLLPVIAGLAYELIRFAGKHQRNRILMTLLAPGLWLQRLTTREPTLDQIEVSIRALKEVLAGARRNDRTTRVEVDGVMHARHPPAPPGVPPIERNATVTWEGTLSRGTGKITAGTGAFKDLDYSLPIRIGAGNEGKTSPEELLAAAHAGCLATGIAGELSRAKTPPEHLDVTANVVMDEVEGKGHVIVESQVQVRARAGDRRGRVQRRRSRSRTRVAPSPC